MKSVCKSMVAMFQVIRVFGDLAGGILAIIALVTLVLQMVHGPMMLP